MGKHRPSVEIVTPFLPDVGREGLLMECMARVARQTYRLDFNGTIMHTVVVDGQHGDMPVWPTVRWLWHPDGPHHDHGSAAINRGVKNRLCDLVMQLADDEWLEDTAVQQLVMALASTGADFAMFHRRFPSGATVTGVPAEKWNLTTGLFWPRWWEVADMISGPSGFYSQPGADGQLAYDWLLRGAQMVVVPEVLSHTVANPGQEIIEMGIDTHVATLAGVANPGGKS